MKRILLVTTELNATDRKCWSGIPFSIYQQLQKYYEVDTLCLSTKSSKIAALEILPDRYIRKKYVSVQFTKAFGKKAARIVSKAIQTKNYDCIITFSVRAAGVLAYLKTDIPTIFYADCVMSEMINYYWYVSSFIANQMNEIQKLAIQNAKCVMLTSQWAKNAAIKDYNCDEKKIIINHFGANVEVESFAKEAHTGINLLFVGKDGKRKGVDVAIDCVKWLNKLDPQNKYRLDIVGCSPEMADDPNIVVHGFIDRNIPEERAKLDRLRALSDLFILPTKAECAGIVFNEAGAYSIPSISYDTGGVSDYILNGVNGLLLPLGASGKDFALRIINTLADRDKLNEMSQNARKLYLEEYNWEKAGSVFAETIEYLSK